jgi:hypothetical protein
MPMITTTIMTSTKVKASVDGPDEAEGEAGHVMMGK